MRKRKPEKERAGHQSLGGGLEDKTLQLLRKNPQKTTRPWDELKEAWLRATEEQWPEESIRLPVLISVLLYLIGQLAANFIFWFDTTIDYFHFINYLILFDYFMYFIYYFYI